MNGKYWDKPWSLVDGCTPCSPGCDHCWSAAMTHRFDYVEGGIDHLHGEHVFTDGQRFNGKVVPRPDRLDIPLRTRKPTVFSIWNDLFHEDVPWTFIKQSLEVMARASRHTFLIFTKRPALVSRFSHTWGAFRNGFEGNPHIWLIVTVCNQAEADEKIPLLLQTPAAHKGVNMEPMLGLIDFKGVTRILNDGPYRVNWHPLTGHGLENIEGGPLHTGGPKLDAVILGGETGPGARPMHPDWVRSVRDQCKAAGVPFFFKQWGKWCGGCQVADDVKVLPGDNAIVIDISGEQCPDNQASFCSPESDVRLFPIGKKAGRLLDGREHNELPWRTT